MYLHIGDETILKSKDILGIFDIETTSISKKTREFLANAEKMNNVIYVSYDLPKSFIITTDNKVYISQISASTLRKRYGYIDEEKNITYVN